jgi:transcriptional regulator with XRE-family HTH domain
MIIVDIASATIIELLMPSKSAIISENIRRLRGVMSMRELGRRAGVSVGYVSKLEDGIISPTISKLERIAAALNVPIEALFREERPSGSETR